MKRFKFALANILEYRKQSEQELKQQYLRLRAEVQGKEVGIRRLLDEKKDLMEVTEHTVGRMQVQRRYLLGIDQEVTLLKNAELELKSASEIKLKELIKAQQERKVLEKLEEKQAGEYRLLVKRQEQAQLDEMANRNRKAI
ncbi:flagellar export protein FliJ [Liquorilactobacillus satsumensis]|uniref:Flagellar FliJ protein n=2 Tax=Liquorilactobacillus satsumensis TaxID=259059 RepID=A0A0R1V0L3_9LACO|nr:flagellar export protein FliJ [Liquorilactobacillus satsumensis]AJA34314.1 flagellar FliJ protein [Liquorilactobacillus satsumensis]KRL99161.1 hypothetical protein FD50_GL000441 [Liquorilactobacillus satsumensis DSM 16230 = JCM 12392]MCP9329284.1 flagellar export protein FliJ [Liquorilactobacillus satsumensis]